MARKGQGISINVVVIAAIALLVLVILSVLVIRSGNTVNQANQCGSAPQETCVAQYTLDGNALCNDGQVPVPSKTCSANTADNKVTCCRTI